MGEKLSPPDVASPVTPNDRDYLRTMYEEHAQHARLHEELRGGATAIFMALIAGLLAYAVGDAADSRREWIAGSLICGASLVGALVNFKHYERYELHLAVLRGFRKSLEKGLSAQLHKINDACTDYHNKCYWFTHKWIKLHVLWLIVYVVTFLIGVVLILDGIRL